MKATGAEYCPPTAGSYERTDYAEHDERSDTGEIKQDIDRTRAQMDRTIDELSDRLRPRHLLDQALGAFSSMKGRAAQAMPHSGGAAARAAGRTAKRAGRTLGHQIKEHPIPSLLITAGIGWLIYEQMKPARSYRTTIYERDVYDHYGGSPYQTGRTGSAGLSGAACPTGSAEHEGGQASYGQTIREKVAGAGETIRHQASSAADAARRKMSQWTGTAQEQARHMGQGVQSAADRAREQMKQGYRYGQHKVLETIEDYPMAVGLSCMAAGLLAGLSLPHTRTEDRWLGEPSDRLKDYAKESGEELLERGKQVARSTADAAADEARAQGLTPSQMKEKVKNVAEETRHAARSAAKGEGSSEMKDKSESIGGDTSAHKEGNKKKNNHK